MKTEINFITETRDQQMYAWDLAHAVFNHLDHEGLDIVFLDMSYTEKDTIGICIKVPLQEVYDVRFSSKIERYAKLLNFNKLN